VYGDAGRPRLLDDMVNRIIVPMVETAREQALQLRLTEAETWSRGIAELTRSGIPPEGTFFYTWFKGIARKPPCHPAIHSAP
jgi:hypothetical protein